MTDDNNNMRNYASVRYIGNPNMERAPTQEVEVFKGYVNISAIGESTMFEGGAVSRNTMGHNDVFEFTEVPKVPHIGAS